MCGTFIQSVFGCVIFCDVNSLRVGLLFMQIIQINNMAVIVAKSEKLGECVKHYFQLLLVKKCF